MGRDECMTNIDRILHILFDALININIENNIIESPVLYIYFKNAFNNNWVLILNSNSN